MNRNYASDLRIAVVTSEEAAALVLHERLAFRGQSAAVFPHLEAMWRCLDVRAVDLLLLDLRDASNAAALAGDASLYLPSFTVVATFGRFTSALPARLVFSSPPSDDQLSDLLQLALCQRWPHAAVSAEHLH